MNWLVPGSALNHSAELRVSRDKFFFKVTAFMSYIWYHSHSIPSDTEVLFFWREAAAQQTEPSDLFQHLPHQAPKALLGSWEGQTQLLPTQSCRWETKAATEVKAWALCCFWAFRKHNPGKAGSVQGSCCAESPEGSGRAGCDPQGASPCGSVLGLGERAEGRENKRSTVGSGIWRSD